jgi:hypothetical protein
MVDQDDLKQALLDVRKAYRLLFWFQRRILDLVQELSGKLGQEFYVWLPAGDNESIGWLRNPLQTSAWKMLPIHNASFLFLPPGADRNAPRKGEWLLEIQFYDDGEPEESWEEPTPQEFKDPTESHSKIYLYAFVAQQDLGAINWYHDLYYETDWPAVDEVPETTAEGLLAVGLSIDLADLPNSAAVENLAERFRNLVKAQSAK